MSASMLQRRRPNFPLLKPASLTSEPGRENTDLPPFGPQVRSFRGDFMNCLSGVLCGLVLTALPSISALADTIYSYQGNPFEIVGYTGCGCGPGLPFTTDDFVSGSFTVSTPLRANRPFSSIEPIAFSFSNGVDTLTSNDSFFNFIFEVGTDSTGAITRWYIVMETAGIPPGYYGISTANTVFGGNPYIADSGLTPTTPVISPYDVFGDNGNDPGTWTVSETTPSTPEPSSIVLLGSGMVGLATLIKRRLAA